jgi:hypothetical protein
MSKIISVEVTTLIQFSPEPERERLSLHFKGKSLARLLSIVDNVEAGNFYEAAKTYFKNCNDDERDALDERVFAIIDGIGKREVNKLEWAERKPGQTYVETSSGVVNASTLDYPRYTLIQTSKLSQEATLQEVLGNTPSL